MSFTENIEYVARGFDWIGVTVMMLGLVWSAVLAARMWRTNGGRRAYQALRETIGGVLLLSLEILVAADLIRTIATSPTLRDVSVLAIIVLIRTFLSFSLQIEIDGAPPWRRALTSGAAVIARAARDDSAGA